MVIRADEDGVYVVTREGEFRRLPPARFDQLPCRGEIVQLSAAGSAHRRRLMWIAAMAAALLILAVIIPSALSPTVSLAAELEIEMNPTVYLALDSEGIVRETRSEKLQGQEILEVADLEGQGAPEAAASVVEAAADMGLLSLTQENVILLTEVAGEDAPGPVVDTEHLLGSVQSVLDARGLPAAVNAFWAAPEAAREAAERGTSAGREMLRRRAEELGTSIPGRALREASLRELPREAGVPPEVLFGKPDDRQDGPPDPGFHRPDDPGQKEDERHRPPAGPRSETPSPGHREAPQQSPEERPPRGP